MTNQNITYLGWSVFSGIRFILSAKKHLNFKDIVSGIGFAYYTFLLIVITNKYIFGIIPALYSYEPFIQISLDIRITKFIFPILTDIVTELTLKKLLILKSKNNNIEMIFYRLITFPMIAFLIEILFITYLIITIWIKNKV